MKKHIIRLFAFIIVVAVITVGVNTITVAAEDDIITIHKLEDLPTGHGWADSWVTVYEPTCTTEGLKTLECNGCDLVAHLITPAIGHHMSPWEVVQEPTCTEAGVEETRCLNQGCTYKEEKKIPALEHEKATRRIEATTSKDGVEETYCTRCNEILSSVVLPKIVAESPKPQEKQEKQSSKKQIKKAVTNSPQEVEEIVPEIATAATEEPVIEEIQKEETTKTDIKEAVQDVEETTITGEESFIRRHAMGGVLIMMQMGLAIALFTLSVPYIQLCRFEKMARRKAMQKIRKGMRL